MRCNDFDYTDWMIDRAFAAARAREAQRAAPSAAIRNNAARASRAVPPPTAHRPRRGAPVYMPEFVPLADRAPAPRLEERRVSPRRPALDPAMARYAVEPTPMEADTVFRARAFALTMPAPFLPATRFFFVEGLARAE